MMLASRRTPHMPGDCDARIEQSDCFGKDRLLMICYVISNRNIGVLGLLAMTLKVKSLVINHYSSIAA
jgi:hypothetical protein